MSNAWSGSLKTGTRCRLSPQTSLNLPRRSAPWSDPARIFLALVLGVFVGALVPATAVSAQWVSAQLRAGVPGSVEEVREG